MSKLIVIVGITGNQGGSVATRFLQDPTYKVRGLTRNPSSARAQHFSSLGAEIVAADLDDVSTLIPAFKGASVIFTVTNYWEPFFRPDCRAEAAKQGISCRRFAYDVESRQGRNIADAVVRAGVVEGLEGNGFVVSTLSHARQCSGGMFEELYHFDAKAEVFPGYVRDVYPQLAEKMSCVQTGFFMTSYRLAMGAYFGKQADGSFRMSFTTDPDAVVPHLDVNADTGEFVYAVVTKMPPGRDYMAAGTFCSWKEFLRIWSEITGKKAEYKQVSTEEMIEGSPDKEFGREIADMFTYCSNPGYDGGMKVLTAEDLRKAGAECHMVDLRDFFAKQDWTSVFEQ